MPKDLKSYNGMTIEDLSKALVDKTVELKQAKTSLAAGNLINTSKMAELKREIARINTAINKLNVVDMEEK